MCGRLLHDSSMSPSTLTQQYHSKRQNSSLKNTTVNSLCITSEPYALQGEEAGDATGLGSAFTPHLQTSELTLTVKNK